MHHLGAINAETLYEQEDLISHPMRAPPGASLPLVGRKRRPKPRRRRDVAINGERFSISFHGLRIAGLATHLVGGAPKDTPSQQNGSYRPGKPLLDQRPGRPPCQLVDVYE